jgi:hypothetical protein
MAPARSRRGPSQRLSARARQLLSGVRSQEATSEERVDLPIRTAQAAAESRERLEAAGAELRTVAGDVCTASAPPAALDRLAELDDVVSIDVAGELYPEQRPQGG